MEKERLQLKTDEQWRDETGVKWPDERPLDEEVLKNSISKKYIKDVLAKLDAQQVGSISELLGTYDKPDGDASLLADGLAKGSAGALMLFIQKVKAERATGKGKLIPENLLL